MVCTLRFFFPPVGLISLSGEQRAASTSDLDDVSDGSASSLAFKRVHKQEGGVNGVWSTSEARRLKCHVDDFFMADRLRHWLGCVWEGVLMASASAVTRLTCYLPWH